MPCCTSRIWYKVQTGTSQVSLSFMTSQRGRFSQMAILGHIWKAVPKMEKLMLFSHFHFFLTHFKHLHILSTALLFATLVKWILNTGPVNPVSCGPPHPLPLSSYVFMWMLNALSTHFTSGLVSHFSTDVSLTPQWCSKDSPAKKTREKTPANSLSFLCHGSNLQFLISRLFVCIHTSGAFSGLCEAFMLIRRILRRGERRWENTLAHNPGPPTTRSLPRETTFAAACLMKEYRGSPN